MPPRSFWIIYTLDVSFTKYLIETDYGDMNAEIKEKFHKIFEKTFKRKFEGKILDMVSTEIISLV